MSTVSDAIITWLKTNNISKIDTDRQSANTMEYALIKEPTVNEKRYVSGKVIRTEYYQFSARLDSQTDYDRRENGSWFEDLEKWIAEQDASGNFPVIQNADVSKIRVTSSFCLGATQDNNSIYSITIEITYSL